MSELVSEVDAHDARPPSLADCLAALRESTAATLRLVDALSSIDHTDAVAADREAWIATGNAVAALPPPDTDVVTEPSKEDRWIGTGEPVIEAPPPVHVDGAMPPDHCVNHRDHRPDCGHCITAEEAQATWRSKTENRIAAAKAEVAAEIAAAAKPLPPGRQAFREAKVAFDDKRQPASQDQKTAITTLLAKRGITDRHTVLEAISDVLGRRILSRNEMTRADATRVMDRLDAIPLPPEPALPEADHPRTVDVADGPPARSVEHPVDVVPAACGRCGHAHDDECQEAVVEVEDGEEAVMPCGCPTWVDERMPADVVHDAIPVVDEPDDPPRSDVQAGHVDTTHPPVRSDDGPATDAADGPSVAELTENIRELGRQARRDEDDEFDRARPGWRDYDTGGTYAMTTTGGPNEPPY